MSKITISSDVLVAAAFGGAGERAVIAGRTLSGAELLAVPLATICTFVRELCEIRGVDVKTICEVVRALLNSNTVAADRAAIAAGLTVLENGGNFSDGVAALEGRRLGAGRYVSLDPDVSAHIEAILRRTY